MISKRINPESFDFGMSSIELIGIGSKGLDKQAMVKRGSADFRIVLDSFEGRPGHEYLHIITTGGAEMYGSNCFVAGTPVQTPKGVRLIEELSVGEQVYTAMGSVGTISKVFKRGYSGPLNTLKIGGLPGTITGTGNHPVFSVSKKDVQYRKERRRKGRISEEAFQEELQELILSAKGTPMSDLSVMDYVYVPDPTTYEESFNTDSDLLEAYVMGVWVAEGCCGKHYVNTKKGKSLRKAELVWTIAAADSDAPLAQAIRDYAKEKNRCIQEKLVEPDCTCRRFDMGHTEMAKRFQGIFGHGAKNKSCFESVKKESAEWIKHFIAGWLDGDGHITIGGKSHNVVRASSASISLILDMQRLLARIGVLSTVSLCHNRESNGCLGKGDRLIYQLNIAGSQSAEILKMCRRLKRGEETYNGPVCVSPIRIRNGVLYPVRENVRTNTTVEVFNICVEEDHTYLTTFAVFNCNGDYWNFDHMTLRPPYPESPQQATIRLDGGLKKYHDVEYMKNGEVFKEHKTRRNNEVPSGYVVASFTNDRMQRGELLIGVDTNKWSRELQRKSQGQDIYFSIGADVPHDYCSCCGRKATKMSEHCDHMKYHPLELTAEGIRVGVYNDVPKFYDISGVEVPADRIAFALRHIPTAPMMKSASIYPVHAPISLLGSLTGKGYTFHKLAVMEKDIPAMCEGDELVEACITDDDEESRLIKDTGNYTVREVLDACHRSGIMLSPQGLFKLLARELQEDDECRHFLEGVDSADLDMDGVFSDCCQEDEVLSDSSYDTHELPDLNLLNMVSRYIPSLGLREQPVADRVIHVVIHRPIRKEAKVSTIPAEIRDYLSKEYAKYTVSYVNAHKDNDPEFAMRKISAIVNVK